MKIAAELEKHTVQTVQSIHAVERERETSFCMNLLVMLGFVVTFSACSKCLYQICLAAFFVL